MTSSPWDVLAGEIIAAYRSDMPAGDIPPKFGISETALYALLKRHGVPVRGYPQLPPEPVLLRLYIIDRLTARQIGARYGVSQERTARGLRNAGALRGPGRRAGRPRAPRPRCEHCGAVLKGTSRLP